MLQLLILMHLFGDFIIQNDKDVLRRKERPFWGNIVHILKTEILYVIIGLIFMMITKKDLSELLNLIIAILILIVSHFLIDLFKGFTTYYKNIIPLIKEADDDKFNFKTFIIDQLLHITAIYLIFSFLDLDTITFNSELHNFLVLINAVLISTMVGHYFIVGVLSCLCKRYSKNNKNFETAKFIGIIERILIISFMILGSFEFIAIVMGLKVFSNFLDEDSKITDRNSFIIGNLLSIMLAGVGYLYYISLVI